MASPNKAPLSRSLRLYERIAVAFVGLTVILLLGILYLSVARATIRVTVRPSEVVVTATADVTATGGENALQGAVKTITLERSRTFTLPSAGATAVPEKAFGTVTLKNDSGSPQPLVATTRLLSADGILFRLVSGVTVPARGEITAAVKADQPGQAGEIGPGRFTIPGLNESQQKLIYAVSTEAMQGGVQYVRTLTTEDVASAKLELTEAIKAEALATLENGLDRTRFSGTALGLEEIAVSTDVPIGSSAGSFTLTLNVEATLVAFDSQAIAAHASQLLDERVPVGFALAEGQTRTGQVQILSTNIKEQTARLSLDIAGDSYLTDQAEVFRPARFLGRSGQEVETLLSGSEHIEDVSLSFTPFWLKRIPTLEDHLSITIIKGHAQPSP